MRYIALSTQLHQRHDDAISPARRSGFRFRTLYALRPTPDGRLAHLRPSVTWAQTAKAHPDKVATEAAMKRANPELVRDRRPAAPKARTSRRNRNGGPDATAKSQPLGREKLIGDLFDEDFFYDEPNRSAAAALSRANLFAGKAYNGLG